MKKILTLLIALMIALLSGCNAGSTEKPSEVSGSNYQFDYFLDEIESYKYYDYLITGYITPIIIVCWTLKWGIIMRIRSIWQPPIKIPYIPSGPYPIWIFGKEFMEGGFGKNYIAAMINMIPKKIYLLINIQDLEHEKLVYPFTDYDGKKIVHYIEWSSLAFSTQLTLEKL